MGAAEKHSYSKKRFCNLKRTLLSGGKTELAPHLPRRLFLVARTNMPVRSSTPKASRVTVRSIAAYAGVSIGSVSTVLNNRHVERRITVETVEKIRAAAAKLGYLPNISARRLRSGVGGKNNVVLALVTSFEAPLTLVNYFLLGLRQALMNG